MPFSDDSPVHPSGKKTTPKDLLPARKIMAKIAPQRPITTHRTTATPKAGPGVVRKNPGVGNGDDEAAELMQQVGISCVHNRNPLGEGALAALTGELCLCSCGKTCLVCVSQQSS